MVFAESKFLVPTENLQKIRGWEAPSQTLKEGDAAENVGEQIDPWEARNAEEEGDGD